MYEASELIVYSRRLEEKSQELEAATKELRAANERIKELDKLKDDFVTAVGHELRTPLTSIRAFSEIVNDHPDLPVEERREFLQIIVQESERLTRLLNDILDQDKMAAGKIGSAHLTRRLMSGGVPAPPSQESFVGCGLDPLLILHLQSTAW